MKIEYDPEKNQRNIEERSLSFELVADFDFESALIRRDLRREYGEARFNALGYIGDTIFHITFTPRGERIRVISFRRANSREVKRYAET